MPLCSNCLIHGTYSDMTRVQFALPELYPELHYPKHARNKQLENTLNWNAFECPRCKYQSPLEGWDMWQKRQKPTKKQWQILREQGEGPQLVF